MHACERCRWNDPYWARFAPRPADGARQHVLLHPPTHPIDPQTYPQDVLTPEEYRLLLALVKRGAEVPKAASKSGRKFPHPMKLRVWFNKGALCLTAKVRLPPPPEREGRTMEGGEGGRGGGVESRRRYVDVRHSLVSLLVVLDKATGLPARLIRTCLSTLLFFFRVFVAGVTVCVGCVAEGWMSRGGDS